MKIYHTETLRDYKALMIELEDKGVLWDSGMKPTSRNHWIDEKEDTTVLLEDNKVITYADLGFVEDAYPRTPIRKYKAINEELSSDKRYILYLNNIFYGVGSLKYIKELINDWLDMKFYGSDKATFKIVEERVAFSEDSEF